MATIVRSRAETGIDFDEFFRDHYHRLVGALYLLCGSASEAQDISREAMARAWERWDRVRLMDAPVGYVYRIGLNLHRRQAKRARALRKIRLVRGETSDLEAVEARSDIGRALRTLPSAQREALVVFEFLGFGGEEAARLPGIRPRPSSATSALGGSDHREENVPGAANPSGMRRTLAVLAAAALLGVGAPGRAQVPEIPPGPCQRVEERVPGAPLNVELVTVTESSFALTWLTCDALGHPAASDTSVAFGTSPNPASWTSTTVEEGVAFHHAELTGLEPGTTYFYQVFSAGLPGRFDRYHPGSFTTLTLPPGQLLLTFAVVADAHLGESVSGLATSTPTEFPPAYRADVPYPEVMARAAVSEINRRRVDLTVLPADNSSHGERHQLEDLRTILHRLHRRFLIARGAHDRPNQYGAGAECPPDGDCFRDVFFPGLPATDEPRHVFFARVVRGFTFISLDSANLQSGAGEISDEQLAWLDERLARADARGEPAVIFFHHPVSEWSTTLAIPPLIFGVNQRDAQEFLRTIAAHDVRLVINAHTHRNWISYSPWTGEMPILEVGPTKEYPGGYSIVRVYEGGLVRNFYRLRCDFCRRWVETTRWQYLGRYPDYTTGSLRDRNFVHRWGGPDVPGVPSLPLNAWPPLVPMEA